MSIATLESIRAAIGAVMLAVPRIGIVHPYERYAKNDEGFRPLYMWQPPEPGAPRELRGWFIRRTATREIDDTSTKTIVQIDWQMRGYMGFQDALASEVTFDNLIEQLRHRFLADLSLGGLLDDELPAGAPLGPQLVESAPYMFAGALCHGARLDWTTSFNRSQTEADPTIGDFRIFHANWDIPPIGNVVPPPPADETADATDHVIISGD